MQNITIQECFGSITKEEDLRTLDKTPAPNTLVLETIKPFSGYYSHAPETGMPQTIFIALANNHSFEEIDRATKKIKAYIGYSFDAVKAEVFLNNHNYHCIRLYALEDYSVVPQLQEAYQSDGFKMHNSIGHTEGTAMIKLYKVFLLDEFEPGIYLNKGKSKMGYIEVPSKLNFSQFRKATQEVKNNWNGISFDAAQGTFHRRKGITDTTRIYSNEITTEMLKKLNKLYLKAYENIQ